MIFRLNNFVIGQFEYLYLILPFAVILAFLLLKRYVKEENRLYKKPGEKIVVFVSRILFLLLLLLAFSNPYLEFSESYENVTKVKILIDNSFSAKLYDIDNVISTIDSIDDEDVSIDLDRLNLDDYSTIGNSILNNLAPSESILVVTDGQNNFGTDLEDVFLFAASINSKIFSVKMEEKEEDARIIIEGPSKVISGVENSFKVVVNEVGSVGRKKVSIFIDEELVHSDNYLKEIEIKRGFGSGNHIIKAVLETTESDFFIENNVFYKTISVFKKPKVLFVSQKSSPVSELYFPFYSIDVSKELKSDLSEYYAVILNNIPANKLSESDIDNLDDFVSDGNGLFVIGGKSSYDWGDYNTSLLSDILPVNVGKARKKSDVTNIILIIDNGAYAYDPEKSDSDLQIIDIQKAILADVVRSISVENKVGLIEANLDTYVISELSELGPKKEKLLTEVSKIRAYGITQLGFAADKAYQILRLNKGSRSMVMITDGYIGAWEQKLTLDIVGKAYSDGIKTFLIGVGENADIEFLQSVKEAGGGEYFHTNEQNRIKLYFGNPDEIPPGDLKVFVYDSNHFITKELKELGNIYGYNSVFPKSTARLLLTTSTGDPVLTVWNYGLGRVASLTTDDGSLWIPDLLNLENSKVLVKTLNWLIEDPERKNNFVINIPDLRIGETSEITLRTTDVPKENNFNFYELSKGLFKAFYYPNETGFSSILGMPVAVNYKKEYLNLGINKDFEKLLAISGGEMLENNPDEIAGKIKALSRVETLKTASLSWVFIIVAISIYLVEILIRRLYELKITEK